MNVDMALYTNSKITYVAHSLSKTIKSVFLDSKRADCMLHKKIIENRLAQARMQRTTHTHLITGERGYLNILAGEIFYVFKCTAVDVTMRRTLDCYNNIPVYYKDRERFVEPISNTLTHLGSKVPCSQVTPVMYSLNGEWFKITPRPIPTTSPNKLQPSYIETGVPIIFEDFSNLLKLGIYSEDTLRDYTTYITYPFQREYAKEHVTDAVVQSGTDINMFHLEKLFSKEQLQSLSTSVLEYLTPHLQTLGTVGGTLFIVVLIFQTLSYLLTVCVNFRLLFKAFGLTTSLCASVFTALTTYLLNNRFEPIAAIDADETELRDVTVDTKIYPEVPITSADNDDTQV